ncbi:MAG: DUF302 domain-containing protein [Candidatus Promineifilaceae bacterium]|nr:DUF302 domain-containing protein [Candidatus Promineifilaceae bacterium]
MTEAQAIGLTITLDDDFESALTKVTEALKTEGFGILTEIDVKATLKKKLDEEFRPYRILGACNPPLAHQALNANPDVGLLLPCNVTVDQVAPGRVKVSLLNPMVMVDNFSEPALKEVATEATARLERVANMLEGK